MANNRHLLKKCFYFFTSRLQFQNPDLVRLLLNIAIGFNLKEKKWVLFSFF